MLHRDLNMLCLDCGIDTDKNNEFYMIHDHLWEQAVPNKHQRENRVLCIGCLEERLGRKLLPNDFTNTPVNKKGIHSYRLISRLKGINLRERDLIFKITNNNFVRIRKYNEQELLVLQLLITPLTRHQLLKKSAGKINKCSFFKIIERWEKIGVIKTEKVPIKVLGFNLIRIYYYRNFKNPLPNEIM